MSMRTKLSTVAGSLMAATLGLSSAIAADLGGTPVRPPRDFSPPYERRLDLERWTGFYLGGTLGYGWGDGRTIGDAGAFSFDQQGAIGTILAGYNWQLGRSVFGLEADVGTGQLAARTSTAFGTLEHDLHTMGSFRGRAGFLLTPSLLLYGTAGLAWANMDIGYAGAPQKSDTFFGYQVGTGAELMMTNNVTLRLEYIYTDLERDRVLHSGQANFYDPDFHTVRAGIAFKF